MKYLTFTFLLASSLVYSQKEANIWYFGANAGIDFNSGAPVALIDGMVNTTEGSASIADKNGNLLFYSDGVSVWTKNHSVMPNGTGLMGDPSSTQSAVIAPKPGSTSLYYIFTVDYSSGVNGLRYSIVDLTLNGGLGDVTTKNVLMNADPLEKVNAVRHSNKVDIWVITHEYNNNNFVAYLLTSAGVSTTPVTSSIGSSVGGSSSYKVGYLKTSPDGSKIASVNSNLGLMQLADFNATTGMVSNMIEWNETAYAYGVEFSPNNQILYMADWAGEVYQYDISNWNQASISSSKLLLSSGLYGGAVQLGPDGKIYVSDNYSDLGVINNPNQLGTGCNFVAEAIDLNGKYCTYGLPPFITSYFISAAFTFHDQCFEDTTFFTSNHSVNPDSIKWNFGISGTNQDTSTLLNPYYIFPDTGNFAVTLLSWTGGICDTAIDTVHIYGKFLKPISDTAICNGTQVILVAQPNASYEWSDGSNNDSLTVTNASTVWVDIDVNGCVLRDSILVSYVQFGVNVGRDTILCPKQTLLLNATVANANSYTWQDNSKSATFLVKSPAFYWVDVNVNGCVERDSILVSYYPGQLNLGNDTILCSDSSIYSLKPNITGASYLWSDGSTSNSLDALPKGLYWVSLIDFYNCLQTDSVMVTYNTPKVSLGPDKTICMSENLLYNTKKEDFIQYQWNTGETDPIIVANETGEYSIAVLDKNYCYAYDTVKITVEGCSIFIPDAFSPNGDGINDVFGAKGENITEYSLQIFNRWGELVFETKNMENTWNGNSATLGVYTYVLTYKTKFHKDLVAKYGKVTLLDRYAPNNFTN